MNKNDLLSTIGNTPLVKLKTINPYPNVDIYVKLEFFTPSGIIKDRFVRYIFDDVEETGQLKP
ncbi:MAG: cystathionine beta-synthase, partial [Gammaproteobacteria bacterium]|nr:cystathionine beta-synthase [Gammaproteobacteria bacterium]